MTCPSPPFLFTPLYLSGRPGRCGAAAGTRGSRLASPLPRAFGTRLSTPLVPDQVVRFFLLPHSGSFLREGGEAQFVAYYPIGKCPLKSMNSFIGLNFNNARDGVEERRACVSVCVCACVCVRGWEYWGATRSRVSREEKGECSWPRRALCDVTCVRGRLQTPIHLPNFGQFNKLQEKLLWLCQGG